jgi:hypothetical protein
MHWYLEVVIRNNHLMHRREAYVECKAAQINLRSAGVEPVCWRANSEEERTLGEDEPVVYSIRERPRVAGRVGKTRGRVAGLPAYGRQAVSRSAERRREANSRSGDAKPIEHYLSFRPTL